jgi:drug/metabolite transporter (DMT)-like permease
MPKYRMPAERIGRECPGFQVVEPVAATDEELRLAHVDDYVRRVAAGELSCAEVRAMGFPWSLEMVERSRRSVGATLAACHAASLEGIACNLAGGTHHAHADRGSGYCVFNDAAVATRVIPRDRPGMRVAIIDLDIQFSASVLVTVPFAAAFESFEISWNAQVAAAWLWSVLVFTGGGISLLFLMIRHGATAEVTSIAYLVPAVTAVMVWLMFGESFGPLALTGMVVTIVGVALVVRKLR